MSPKNKYIPLSLEIVNEAGGVFEIVISGAKDTTIIFFDPRNKALKLSDVGTCTGLLLKENIYQFRKVLHLKRPDTYYVGCRLKFILWDKKDVAAFNNLNKIVVLDKRDGKHLSYVTDKPIKGLIEVFTDGSFMEKKQQGGLAVIIKSPDENYKLHTFTSKNKSSSTIELESAMMALRLLKKEEKIRLITDSQYVRKGLTEWIMIWQRNNWTTASGEKVKNIKDWITFDKLCENKYIEFQYIKSHSDHFENSLADWYAKDQANKH